MSASINKDSFADEIKLLKRISEECPDAVIRIAADGKILYANPASELVLGYWNSGVGQFIPNNWKHLIANTIKSGASQETESECVGMTFSFHVVPLQDDNSVILYGRDITERKHTEKELRRNEQRFALVLRGTNDGIWDFDLQNGQIHFSPRWKEMLGYDPKVSFRDGIQKSVEWYTRNI